MNFKEKNHEARKFIPFVNERVFNSIENETKFDPRIQLKGIKLRFIFKKVISVRRPVCRN